MRANPLTKDTRVVIATAMDSDAVAADAAKLNVSRVLRKPIDLKQLKDAIARLV
jgi:CheY-like chemotaxis protein